MQTPNASPVLAGLFGSRLPDRQCIFMSHAVTSNPNKLPIVKHGGRDYYLAADRMMRIGFDAKVCPDGPTLLPENQKFEVAQVGTRVIMAVEVDADNVPIRKFDNVLLWILADEAGEKLRQFEPKNLTRVLNRQRKVIWIGPKSWLPEHHLGKLRQVYENNVWKDVESTENQAALRQRPLTTMSAAFGGMTIRTRP